MLLLGGRVRGGPWRPSTTGRREMLAGFVIDLAFIGANGISREHGLTTPDPAVERGQGAGDPGLAAEGLRRACTPSSARSASAGSPRSATSRRSSPTPRCPRPRPTATRSWGRRSSGSDRDRPPTTGPHPLHSPDSSRRTPSTAPSAVPRLPAYPRTCSVRPGATHATPHPIGGPLSRRKVRAVRARAATGTRRPLLRCRRSPGRWHVRRAVPGPETRVSGGDTINVLMVNNPQMVDLQKLTAENFTKETGIKVNFTVLPENDVRDKISQEFSSQAGQYDVATLSATSRSRSTPRTAGCAPLDDYVAKDPAFDQDDILKPMRQSLTGDDGKVYGQPFYGESSFLMYRKDVLEAKGLTMPAQAHLAAGRRPRRQGRRRRARHEGHLPARPARLGRGVRAADHGRQHLRRHLVRQGLEGRRSTRPSSRRRPSSTSTWSASTARPAPRRPASPSASTT